MKTSLTPPERETVILMDDASGHARITSYQRKLITRLGRNPAAQLVERHDHGSTKGATFTIPAALVSFRSKKVSRPGAISNLRSKADNAA